MEPGSFQNQGQLLELALNGNRIHLLTADIFQGLDHLRILYLAGNDITRLLDYTFRGLLVRHTKACWSFHFTFDISKIRASQDTFNNISLHVLQRLQELHLQHNSVEVLADQALVGLTSLALLDLSSNNLHTIGPASLQPLVSLQVLRITGDVGVLMKMLPFFRSALQNHKNIL